MRDDLKQARDFFDAAARKASPDGELRRTLPDDWQPEVDHTKHRGFTMTAFARCEECALRTLRWGLTQPESSHAGRNARRERDIREKAGLPV